MDILGATAQYEKWMTARIRVVKEDLAYKHEQMRESPFAFLRATFYRWIQLWKEFCETEASAPAVLAVGDLHSVGPGRRNTAANHGRLFGFKDQPEAAGAGIVASHAETRSDRFLQAHAHQLFDTITHHFRKADARASARCEASSHFRLTARDRSLIRRRLA